MAWTFVRPSDPELLKARPLLDLGTGDGQTVSALVEDKGLVVGLDHSIEALGASRPDLAKLVCAEAVLLPFGDASFATVLAGDLFHHLSDSQLIGVLTEIAHVLSAGGRLVAWWYEHPGRGGPDDPRHPRSYDDVAKLARDAGFTRVELLELESVLEPAPPTVGLLAGS